MTIFLLKMLFIYLMATYTKICFWNMDFSFLTSPPTKVQKWQFFVLFLQFDGFRVFNKVYHNIVWLCRLSDFTGQVCLGLLLYPNLFVCQLFYFSIYQFVASVQIHSVQDSTVSNVNPFDIFVKVSLAM